MTMRVANDRRPWRPACVGDLAAIGRVAGIVHPDYPESDAVFADRLALHPKGVMLAVVDDAVVGYAIGYPWRGDAPLLDTCLGALPARPDRYWVHDLALLAAARGLGLGQAGASLLRDDAAELGLARMSLIAVGAAAAFWRRVGFADAPGMMVPGCYGTKAVGMEGQGSALDPLRAVALRTQ